MRIRTFAGRHNGHWLLVEDDWELGDPRKPITSAVGLLTLIRRAVLLYGYDPRRS